VQLQPLALAGQLFSRVAVDIWFGHAIWCGHVAAEMGCFVASLAVVDAWGDQLPSGVVKAGSEARGTHGGRAGPPAVRR
jgi:hypothetical protein